MQKTTTLVHPYEMAAASETDQPIEFRRNTNEHIRCKNKPAVFFDKVNLSNRHLRMSPRQVNHEANECSDNDPVACIIGAMSMVTSSIQIVAKLQHGMHDWLVHQGAGSDLSVLLTTLAGVIIMSD